MKTKHELEDDFELIEKNLQNIFDAHSNIFSVLTSELPEEIESELKQELAKYHEAAGDIQVIEKCRLVTFGLMLSTLTINTKLTILAQEYNEKYVTPIQNSEDEP